MINFWFCYNTYQCHLIKLDHFGGVRLRQDNNLRSLIERKTSSQILSGERKYRHRQHLSSMTIWRISPKLKEQCTNQNRASVTLSSLSFSSVAWKSWMLSTSPQTIKSRGNCSIVRRKSAKKSNLECMNSWTKWRSVCSIKLPVVSMRYFRFSEQSNL